MTKQFSNYSDLLTFTRASGGHALRPVSYGSEQSPNATFTGNIDGWRALNANATATAENNELKVVTTDISGAILDTAMTLEVGKIYFFTATSTSATVNHGIRIGTTGNASQDVYNNVNQTGPTTFTHVFVATSANLYVYFRNTGGAGTVTWDNVSVKEVTFDQPDGTLTLFEHPDNIPRVEYDADGNRLGLLVEEARTNLITHSDFDGANPTGWTTFSLGGTRTATTLYGLPAIRFQSTGERPLLQIPLTLSASTTYTISCYIENAGGTPAEILQLNGFSGVTGDSRIYANEADGKGYISNTFTTGTDASGYLRIGIGVVSPSTGDVTITAIQIEEGSFGTSYIKTTGSTATRSADVASIPVADFGYNQSAGSFLIEFSHTDPNGTGYANYALSTSGSSRFLYNNSGSPVWVNFDGSNSINLGSLPFDGSFAKVAVSMDKDGSSGVVDGGSIKTSVATPQDNVITADILKIGSKYSSGAEINGHIKSIKYYPRRLTNAQLQDLTS